MSFLISEGFSGYESLGQDPAPAAGGADPAAAAGSVLSGAADVINAITGAVVEGVRQQNEPHILAKTHSDNYNKLLPKVRKLNTQLAQKKSKLDRIVKEIRKIRRDSQTLKRQLKAQLAALPKWGNGLYKDPATAHSLLHRIGSIDRNGVMASKDVRYNHLRHGPDQRNRLREQIGRNENHAHRQNLKKAWGYLTNIVAFYPFLKNDTSGMGMQVLMNIPARDDLIGKNTLMTIFPWGDGAVDAKKGQVPIWQRSEILGSWLNYYADGYIPGSYFPPMWIYGLRAEEARELDPGAPVGALYEVAMQNFPRQFRPTYHTGSAMEYTQGIGSDAFGATGSAFMNKIVNALRTGEAVETYEAKQSSPAAAPPSSQEVVANTPSTPENRSRVERGTLTASMRIWGKPPAPAENPIDSLSTASQAEETPPLSWDTIPRVWKIGVPLFLGAVLVLPKILED